MTWYAVFYGRTDCNKWYASTMERFRAEDWARQLKEQGFQTKIVTAEAPSEWEGKCQ